MGPPQRVEGHPGGPAPDSPSFRRAILSSRWRCLSPTPRDWSLVPCDHPSVEDDEGGPNPLLNVEALPETVPDTIEHPGRLPAGSIFAHRPAHRWWYLPAMHRGEVLVLEPHDNDHFMAWWVPHAAPHDPPG